MISSFLTLVLWGNVLEKIQAKILVADDDNMVRTTVSKIIEMFGHTVTAVSDGKYVVDIIDDSYDVILLDINMPGMDGFETIAALNGLEHEIPVIFLTGAGSMDYVLKAINLGAYDFLTKPIEDLDIFNVKIRRAIEKRTFIRRERHYKTALEEDVRTKTAELEETNKHLENATVQLMTSLQNAMEEKDFYTAGHTMRVTEYAVLLGLAMDLDEQDMVTLRRAAQFHDIGKLVIDLSCIQKPGKLTDEEWLLIRKHPVVGANIIKPLGFMDREHFIIRHHHERMDGKGYPDGLIGDELDLLTRILMVVDSYDAMTSKRNYRRNMNMEEAIVELQRCAGTQFDEQCVQSFSRAIINFTATGDAFSREYLDNFNIEPNN